ncbi:MAG: transaldolase [Puniceicoccales bacterium]|jgi:transaldolase|nr:transaldolase [Puniceicoccales bacterium]
MSSSLEQLKRWSVVVADTGDFGQLRRFRPSEATTNPSLILRASQQESCRDFCRSVTKNARHVGEAMFQLLLHFGLEILKIIPGRVSLEVDARLSFDSERIITYARELASALAKQGMGRERILIKIAATCEGIQAARELEKEGIHTNLTLIFSLVQAIACAEARVGLVSPFVGRIWDWYQKHPEANHEGESDPGVLSVRRIFYHYKRRGYETQIMAASFRHIEEILALAGCDLLTISPTFLAELQESQREVPRRLFIPEMSGEPEENGNLSGLGAAEFQLQLTKDAMACEKLHEGIRQFCRDTDTLEELIQRDWQNPSIESGENLKT